MTLDGLAEKLTERFPQAMKTGLKMNMVGYADDFIITGNSKEWLEQKVVPIVQTRQDFSLLKSDGSHFSFREKSWRA